MLAVDKCRLMSVTSSSGNMYVAHRLPGVMNFFAHASHKDTILMIITGLLYAMSTDMFNLPVYPTLFTFKLMSGCKFILNMNNMIKYSSSNYAENKTKEQNKFPYLRNPQTSDIQDRSDLETPIFGQLSLSNYENVYCIVQIALIYLYTEHTVLVSALQKT